MKIVLDTNVLISGLLSPAGAPAQVLNLILNGKVRLLIDNRIIDEYSDVLKRPKFGFKHEWIITLLDFISHESDFIAAEPTALKFPDEDDKMFYEVAISGNADNLVTGNIKHFPETKIVVTPREFIELYQKQSK